MTRATTFLVLVIVLEVTVSPPIPSVSSTAVTVKVRGAAQIDGAWGRSMENMAGGPATVGGQRDQVGDVPFVAFVVTRPSYRWTR